MNEIDSHIQTRVAQKSFRKRQSQVNLVETTSYERISCEKEMGCTKKESFDSNKQFQWSKKRADLSYQWHQRCPQKCGQLLYGFNLKSRASHSTFLWTRGVKSQKTLKIYITDSTLLWTVSLHKYVETDPQKCGQHSITFGYAFSPRKSSSKGDIMPFVHLSIFSTLKSHFRPSTKIWTALYQCETLYNFSLLQKS